MQELKTAETGLEYSKKNNSEGANKLTVLVAVAD